MWGGTIAHNETLGVGRVGDFGSHQIEHELSALYDVAHGAGLAVVFPAWLRFQLPASPLCRFGYWGLRQLGLFLPWGLLPRPHRRGQSHQSHQFRP